MSKYIQWKSFDEICREREGHVARIRGMEYGEKVFQIGSNVPPIAREAVVHRCATELLVRGYLRLAGFQYCTQLITSCPSELDKWLQQYCPAHVRIRDEFTDCLRSFEEYITNLSLNEVILSIEQAGEKVSCLIDRIKNDWSGQQYVAYQMIQELFELLVQANSFGLVHLDLKPDNLLYAVRDNHPRVIINDFDISALLKGGVPYLDIPAGRTLPYAAPEQVGVELDGEWLPPGYKTDVFAACLVAYQVLNNGKLPEHLDSTDEAQRRQDFLAIYQKQCEGELGFLPPKHGGKFGESIMKGLMIDPEKRPAAREILDALSRISADGATPASQDTRQAMEGGQTMKSQASKKVTNLGSNNSDVTTYQNDGDVHVGWKPRDVIILFIVMSVLVGAIIFAFQHDSNASAERGLASEYSHETAFSDAQALQTTHTLNDVTDTTQTVTLQTNEGAIDTIPVVVAHQQQPVATEPPSTYGTLNKDVTQEITSTTTTTVTTTTTNFFCYQVVQYSVADYTSEKSISIEGIEITGTNRRFAGGTLEIPDTIDGTPVVSIGAGAFQNLENPITALQMPATVEYICDRAFEHSFTGREIDLSNVRVIGNYAFLNCAMLRTIQLSAHLTEIGTRAFFDNEHTSRTFNYPDNQYAWKACVSLGENALGADGTNTLVMEPAYF